MKQTLSPIDRLRRARILMYEKSPFFSYLVTGMKLIESKDVPTMGVDANGNLYYNNDFIQTLNDDELYGVLIHETIHVGFAHLIRKNNRDAPIWNYACFKETALINSLEGSKKINELKIGDGVFDSLGKPDVVTNVMSRDYSEDMFKVNGNCLIPIEATGEHPFLCLELTKKGKPFKFSEPKWIKAKELIPKKHYLVLPKIEGLREDKIIDMMEFVNQNKTNNHNQCHNVRTKELIVNTELAYLLGLYVADGSKNNRFNTGISISLNAKKESHLVTKVQEISKKIGYEAKCELRGNVFVVKIYSTLISRAFERWCGHKAKNKKIPEFILYHKDRDILRNFLEGYVDGDGCFDEARKVYSCGTASKVLAFQLQSLLLRLGIFPSVSFIVRGVRFINGLELPKQEIYTIVWRMKVSTKRFLMGHLIDSYSRRWKDFGNYFVTPVVKVDKEKYCGKVYNLETRSHTYLVQNIAVHNCDIATNFLIMNCNKMDGTKFELPKGGVIPDGNTMTLGKIIINDVDKKSAEALYDELMKHEKEIKKMGNQGFDKHILLEPKTKEEIAQANKIADEWKGKMAEAYQHAKMRGKTPLGAERLLGELLEHKVDWRSTLYKFITNELISDYTWGKRSRRSYSSGYYMPSSVKENINVAVSIDVSGSIGQSELTDFMAEIVGLSKSFSNLTMRVLIHECEVTDVLEIANGNVDKLLGWKIKGGGGTSHSCVKAKIEEEYPDTKLLIAFTDGYTDNVDFQSEPYKVLWVISKGGSRQVPEQCGGEIVEL